MTGNQPEGEAIPPEGAESTGPSPHRARVDPIIAAVAAGILIVCVILVVMLFQGSTAVSGVPAATCGERTLSYVNGNLVAAGTTASLVSVEEAHGIYRVTVSYRGSTTPLYTTRDCALLLLEGRDMTGTTVSPATVTPTPAATPLKTERPVVELYVMSFCPYGKQAETAMKPVADLLGAKADIRVLYITRVGGSTADSVQSLHGPVEAHEDLRQACIAKYSPERFWAYVSGFNAACFGLSGNASAALACSRNVSAALGISQAEIEACAAGPEGITILSGDEASASAKKATSSPTLLINGVRYSGARSPEAYKQALCGSFASPPAECGTVLSSQQVSAGGSC